MASIPRLHEAKVHSSWVNPNEEYDDAVCRFTARVLQADENAPFLVDFQRLHRRVSHFGLLNSLSQTLLKLAAPGVPDTYQGTEFWDFSLVDPDNRRPVDYALRRSRLAELQQDLRTAGPNRRALARRLLAAKEDGRVKLFVTALTLACRLRHRGLFTTGEYLPIRITGEHADHMVGFIRRGPGVDALVAVPRFLTRLVPGEQELPLGRDVWKDAELEWSADMPARRCTNVFTGVELLASTAGQHATLSAADLFADFPIALLLREAEPGPSVA